MPINRNRLPTNVVSLFFEGNKITIMLNFGQKKKSLSKEVKNISIEFTWQASNFSICRNFW
jgi:hypothetical protein